jgi:tetratricopeptide (TPR) repeat protein
MGWNHLLQLCPTCREGVWSFQEGQAAGHEKAFRLLPFVIGRHAADDAEKRQEADRDLRELLELPPEQRLTRIRRANRRFKGLLLVHGLLNKAKELATERPQSMYELAEAAEQVLLRTLQGPGYYDTLVRARAYQANALRARSKLREADERMASARSLIRHESVTETLVYAEVDGIEGVLRKDQRRFQEAEALLTRSIVLYKLAREPIEAARSLVTLGLMYYHQQEMAQSIETTETALALLSPESDPRLYLCARFNLALFFVESGRFAEGGALLQADALLYQQFANPWTVLRRLWLQGRIAVAAGLFAEAEQSFLDVRAGFVAEGIGYDAALVSLDLALLYLRQNRTAAVKELAEEMREIFTAGDIHREATAALVLFQEAARRETLTAELIEEMTVYLKRARGNPADG